MKDQDNSARLALRVARILIILLTLALLGLTARVVQLQTTPPEKIARLIDTQHSDRAIVGRRGAITDVRGRPLAISCTTTRLFADPLLIDDTSSLAAIVAEAFGYHKRDIKKKLENARSRRYVILAKRITDQQAFSVSTMNLRGLATERWAVREYPHGPQAGQLIGAVGSDGHGLEGLERVLDDTLAPKQGKISYVRDARRRPIKIKTLGSEPAAHGNSVQLTIDLTVQSIAESELERQIRTYHAKHGQCIVMDPRNGHVLAMANYPPFDPNQVSQSTADQRRNRCVTDVFEPGSILKPFIWAFTTEQQYAHLDEMIDCTSTGEYVSPKGRILHDAHPNGWITWRHVLIRSSNIGMAIVGQRLGSRRLHHAVRSFGFGSRTGIALSAESAGLVNDLKRWNHYSQTSIPMGQEIAVTAMQIVRAMGAIANDGVLPHATVILGSNKNTDEAVNNSVISTETAQLTRQVLRQVVTDIHGTGRKAASHLYTIFGKTGTAQIPDPVQKNYQPGQFVASFVGGAPTDEPQLVIGVFIHRPDRRIGHLGGSVAAPAARRVIERTLMYLGVAPDVAVEHQTIANPPHPLWRWAFDAAANSF